MAIYVYFISFRGCLYCLPGRLLPPALGRCGAESLFELERVQSACVSVRPLACMCEGLPVYASIVDCVQLFVYELFVTWKVLSCVFVSRNLKAQG